MGNYLNLVKELNCQWAYIHAKSAGGGWIKSEAEGGGTKGNVTKQVYYEAVADTYFLFARYFSDNFLRKKDYVSYLFRRK